MSKAYYNEFDKFAAAWLRELIKEKLIAEGDVDERDIRDVTPKDLDGYTQCHFFAGIGGWSYALRLAGWPDSRPVWTGSCPCQPWSNAGRTLGAADSRHLWPTWFTLIEKCKPDDVFGEQVASKLGKLWLCAVRADLETLGYAVGGSDFPACSVGAPQPRQRLYFVGNTQCTGLSGFIHDARLLGTTQTSFSIPGDDTIRAWRQLETSPTTLPSLDGIPLWLARKLLHGYGNAIVPQQAAAFIQAYLDIVRG